VDILNFYPYFYCPPSQENRITPEMHVGAEEYRSIRNDPLIKIYCDKPSVIYDNRDKFDHFEGDIHYTLQFLIDSKIKSGVEFPQSPCSY
jgi:DNA polymerase elongation subunit (family B)